MPSSDETRSIFLTGLRNAHAMENQALSIMRPQASRLENYPELASRLERHIGETETQLQRLESLLDSFGDDRSMLKDLAMSVAGSMAAIGHTFAPDEILKNSFANFAFENFEMAAYKSLLVVAEAGGFTSSVTALEQNLREEKEMADWLDQNLRNTTLRFVSLREAGKSAKV